MKKAIRLAVTLILLTCVIVTLAKATKTQANVPSQPNPITLRGFDLLTPDEGWVWMGSRLYWTQTAGQDWRDITPDDLALYTIRAVTFVDTQHGWLALTMPGESGPLTYATARTSNGGSTWQIIPHALFEPGEIGAFADAVYLHFLDAQMGWLVVKQASGSNFSIGTLFKTEDGGETWQRGTLPIGEPVYFATSKIGWVAGGPAGDQLYRTQDGGLTWQAQAVDRSILPSSQERHYQLPQFNDAHTGYLPTVLINAKQHAELELYITENGGDSWQLGPRLALKQHMDPPVPLAVVDTHIATMTLFNGAQLLHVSPTTGKPRIPPSPHSGIIALDMLTANVGWAEQQTGECPEDSACHLETKLLHTTDGGATWTALPLPNPSVLPEHQAIPPQTFPSQATAISRPSATFTRILSGQGFDKCEIATLSQLQTWQDNSPYQAVNLYIGGGCRSCANSALSASYVSQISQQGWTFIPTWVGPQSACWGGGCGSRISNDSTTAYNQGVSEANAAIAVMINLGLAAADGSGAIIYYDLEGYDTTNSACRAAARDFMSGWVARLHEVGSQAGVYGSACAAAINDFSGIDNIPDAIWPAHWIYNSYNQNASVWNVLCIPDGNWANHQRIRQYAGGHNETWGSVTLNIDSDVIDSVVAVPGGCSNAAPVGQNTSRPQMFIDAYTRNDGANNLGCTEGAVYWWGDESTTRVTRQDFTVSDTYGDAVIIHDEDNEAYTPNTIPAYVVHGGILDNYLVAGNLVNYGPATSDEFINLQGAPQSNFANGYLTWDGSAHWHTWPTSFSDWKAEYYNYDLNANDSDNAPTIDHPTLVRNENVAKPDYDWGTGAPEGGHIGVFADKFSVRWTRSVNFSPGGSYRFSTHSDDGVRVWVDNTLIIDHWTDGGDQNYTGDINLSEGDHTVKIEYYENGGFAYFDIDWEQITPSSQVAMYIDTPVAAADVEGTTLVGGWAIDRASASGTGVSAVHVYLDGTAGSGVGLGVASYGGDRPDVAAVYGSQFRYSGYNFSWDSNTTSLGDHTLYIYVYSTIASGWSYDQRQVHVVDTTPPSQAGNLRPDGWTGPYTTDNTPAFAWDAASDVRGIAGYYIALDDWTPDGNPDNDWTIDNVTYWTVPDSAALADGSHFVAITSMDNTGLVNPTDTNTQGDAPYYEFIVDTVAPASAVAALPETTTAPTFALTWSGSDGGSGIAAYDVQIQDGADGTWQDLLVGTTKTSAAFTGQVGHTYYFRCRAFDLAGNDEGWPNDSGDTYTYVKGFQIFIPMILK